MFKIIQARLVGTIEPVAKVHINRTGGNVGIAWRAIGIDGSLPALADGEVLYVLHTELESVNSLLEEKMSLRTDIENAIGNALDTMHLADVIRLADAIMPLVEQVVRDAAEFAAISAELYGHDPAKIEDIIVTIIEKGKHQ